MPPRRPPPRPLPPDVRVMNALAAGSAALAAALLLAALAVWVARQPAFALRQVSVEGEVTRVGEPALRAALAPHLATTLFTVDLAASRAAVETVPWVRRAVVRRVWPDGLRVSLVEHRAVALWAGDDGDDRLVNSHGEVFEANLGDVEDEPLPRFAGPEGSAERLLALHGRLAPVLAPLGVRVDALQLSERGSWRARLDSGATLELGRGEPPDEAAAPLARAERFARTVAEVAAHYQRRLLHADLRHPDGYAVRFEGITTTAAAPAAATR